MKILFSFYFYSFLGFLAETIFCFITAHHVKKRGFLFGPVIPIYGFGSLFIVYILALLKANGWYIFFGSFFFCTIFEYYTSFFLEYYFYIRWWDYSNTSYSFQGRICLRSSLLFGILGVLLTYFIHPLFLTIISHLSPSFFFYVNIPLSLLFLLDFFFTLLELIRIKKYLLKIQVVPFYSRILHTHTHVTSKKYDYNLQKIKNKSFPQRNDFKK